jgi:hypothetical protein
MRLSRKKRRDVCPEELRIEDEDKCERRDKSEKDQQQPKGGGG